MDTILSDWLKALNNLQASVSKDLEEIRKQKAEIQQIRMDVFNQVMPGKYIHDDQRIVLSAPEIVIGNVDPSGSLWGEGGSTIVIRGNQVSLDGAGESGVIRSRAPHIEQIAVDPGPDGVEEVVQSQSAIVSHAKNIVLQSDDSKECFSQAPRHVAGSGIRIHADETVDIDVSHSVKIYGDQISNRLKALNTTKSTLTSDSSEKMSSVKSLITQAEKILSSQKGLNDTFIDTTTNLVDLADLQDQFDELLPALYQAVEGCIRSLSALAETNRQITALEAEQKTISSKEASFKDSTTGSQLNVSAERMAFASVDGDGNIRTNAEAGVSLQTGRVSVTTMKEDGSLIDDSYVKIATHDVDISTVNPKLKDPESHSIEGDYMTEGSVNIKTKNLSIEAVDYSETETGYEEKEQTKDSVFSVRMETMNFYSEDTEGNALGNFSVFAKDSDILSADKDGNATGSFFVSAKDLRLQSVDKDESATGSLNLKAENITLQSTDKEGKALGQVSVNGKNVFVKAVDTDDKGLDKQLAAGGNMVLVAEKMFVGRTDKDNTAKELQMSADKTGIYGTTTAEMQQGEAKAVVQLDGGNIAISGSKAAFYGDNTVNGKTDFKGDVTAPKLTADNLEAKTSFKSKNISDGIAVPGAPSSAKLSAKLKEADAPKSKATESDEEGDA